ncbi:MAG: TetR/AcrR family transcriptional regulator [Desulfotignum sp.]|nr:TetR/AcrR family transcriptional regulator [Desulfotignum sp.]MCF8090288.1 TetR/AcrR family transcriptional regulator [Desulfotignum sp.]
MHRLIASVGSLLAREGFKGMGVNAVAREAGVDKVLIYRYFGGLPGLIAAFGKEGDFWPSTLELAGGDIKRFAALSPDQQLKVFSHQFIHGLRKRPLTIRIMAWEMVEANELTRELESVREQGVLSFFQMFFSFDKNDPDLQTCIMLVGAAISYLLIRSGHIDVYGGISLETDADWQRIESGIHRIIQGLLEK